MIVCPLLLIVSSTVTVVIVSRAKLIIERLSFLGAFGSAILFVLKFLPYAVIWSLFAFVYLFMPNKKVKFASGAIAGIIAGTLFQLFQWAYVSFQIGVSRYNAIYGSFAALPLFLVWLMISWMIVLFGAEVSYAHQNSETFELEPDYDDLSHRLKIFLSLRVAHLLIQNFARGEVSPTAAQIASWLDVPFRLVNEILSDLVACGIVSVTCRTPEQDPTYQPAQETDRFTVAYVMKQLEHKGTRTTPVKQSDVGDKLLKCLEALEDTIEKSPANVKLKDL
jgi:membrane protein